MEIHHVHQSGTYTYTLFNTQDNTVAMTDGDTSCSSVRYTHKHSLFNTQDNTDATADGDTPCSSVSYTHTYTLFNNHDKTHATADGDTSYSSVRYTHTRTLYLIGMIIQTPRQMELHLVHRSGTHTRRHTLSRSLFNIQDNTDATADGDKSYSSVRYTHIHTLSNTQDNTDATADGDTSCSSVRYTHKHSLFNTQDNTEATADRSPCSSVRYTHASLSLILKIIQTPRQMEIHHVHQSGTHTNTLFNTQDNTDATADGDTSCSSVRYTQTLSL